MSRQDKIKSEQKEKIKNLCKNSGINAEPIFKLLKKEKYKSLKLGRVSMADEVREMIEEELR